MTVSPNPNVPAVNQPIADLNALTAVTIQLRTGISSLSGHRGSQYDRAVTFNDLINLGVLDPNGMPAASNVFMNWPANPASTSSTSWRMMGLAQSYMPARNGRLLVLVCGMLSNNTNNSQTYAQLFYGFGTPPVNGAPAAGAVAAPGIGIEVAAGGGYEAFALNAILPTLAANTPYWIDLALYVDNGIGAAANLTVIGMEIP